MRWLRCLAAVGFLLTVPLGQADPLEQLESPSPVLLMGEVEARGAPAAVWLSGDPGEATFSLLAPELVVTAHRHEATARLDVEGEPYFDYEPTEPQSSTWTLHDVKTYLVEADLEAAVRLLPDADCGAHASWDHPGFLFSDPTHSDDFRAAAREMDDMPLAEFRAVPDETLLAEGSAFATELEGVLRVAIRGIDLRVAHAAGASNLDSTVETHGIDVGAAGMAVHAWTDYVLEAPRGATLSIVWAGDARLFGAAAEITATEGLSFEDARHADGERAPSLEVPGPVTSSVHWEASEGGPASVWAFVPQDAAPATIASDPLPSGAWAIVAVASGVAISLLGLGLVAAWRRRNAVTRPPVRATDRSSAVPPEAAMRLFHEGAYHQAVGPLEAAVEMHGSEHELRYALGVSLLRTGRFKQAFEHLRVAVRQNPLFLQLLVTQPETEPVRRDRRFEAFMREEAGVFRQEEATRQAAYC